MVVVLILVLVVILVFVLVVVIVLVEVIIHNVTPPFESIITVNSGLYTHMENFLIKMQTLLGDEYEDFLKCCEGENYRGLRVNTLKYTFEKLNSALGFQLRKTPFFKNGAYLPENFTSPGNHPLHHAGAFYIQEPSATSAVTVLAVEKGDRVLDLCAAPGGKSTQIAGDLMGTGLIWSNEIVKSRANVLLSNFERMGVANGVVSCCHPEVLCSQLEGYFDKVLVDAPCSGEGMFRKNSKAQEQWTQEHSQACGNRQLQILESAKTALKPGGVMVYSTCTFSREENEDVIRQFLQKNPDFELIEPSVDFGRRTMEYAVRIFPMDGGEGHFIAKLRKKPRENYFSVPEISDGGLSKTEQNNAESFLGEIIKNPAKLGRIEKIGDKLYASTFDIPKVKEVQILRKGVLIGEIKKNRIEPCHHMFMTLKKEDFINCVDLDLKDPRTESFLHGEEIQVDLSLKGYTAVCIDGVSCGFGKASMGRLKNKYPKGLRIL